MLVQFGPQTAKNYLIIFMHYIVIMLAASIDASAAVVGGRGWAAGLTTRPLKREGKVEQRERKGERKGKGKGDRGRKGVCTIGNGTRVSIG